MKTILTYILLLGFILMGKAQNNVTTFGIQLKLIIPNSFFSTDFSILSAQGSEFNLSQKVGYSFGMVVRHGFTPNISFETGINTTKRNFHFTSISKSHNISTSADFSITGYEIPLQGLLYVKLSKFLFMNASFGLSIDMYPSDVASVDKIQFQQLSKRRSWLNTALIGNVGFEYRTKKAGYFYFGLSLHRPFTNIFTTNSRLYFDRKNLVYDKPPSNTKITGDYLTLDFRYFFHEDPEKRKNKKKKN